MSRSIALGALLIAALLPAAALAQDTSSSSSSSAISSTSSSSYPSSPEEIQPATVIDPQEFATKAAVAGAFEIESSKLAMARSQNSDIKNFAQLMIDDHGKAAEALKTAAAAQGGITPPATLEPGAAHKIGQLQHATGADFDKLYVQMQTAAHVDAVALFSGYVANGPAGPLKDFADQTLPTLKMHYEHVLTLPH